MQLASVANSSLSLEFDKLAFPFAEIPPEILLPILNQLNTHSLFSFSACSHQSRNLSKFYLLRYFQKNPHLKNGKDAKRNLIGLFKEVSPLVNELQSLEITQISSQDFCKIIKTFTGLECLTLPANLSNKSLKKLSILKNLREIKFLEENIPLQHIALKTMQSLTHVDLSECMEISLESLYKIQKFTHLKSLKFPFLRGLKTFNIIEKLTGLEELSYPSSETLKDVSNYSSLTKLRHLTNLNFHWAKVNPALKPYLEKLPLKEVVCRKILNECPHFYENMTRLEKLNLSNELITLEALNSLTPLTCLTFLKFNRFVVNFQIASINCLNALTHLKVLKMSSKMNEHYGPEAFFLEKLTNLKKLTLGFTCLRDHYLEQMSLLTCLEVLNLNGCLHLKGDFFDSVQNFTQMTKLNLAHCKNLSASNFLKFTSLSNLHHLNLNHCELDNQCMPFFKTAFNLTTLNVKNGKMDLAELACMPALEGLKELNMDGAKFNLNLFENLLHLTSLERLSLVKLDVQWGILDDKFCRVLSHLSHLTFLEMGYNNLNLSFFSYFSLARLTNLAVLGIAKSNISNLEIPLFSHLKKLQFLNLSYTHIKGKRGIKAFKSLNLLQEIHLLGNAISRKDLKDLKKKMPFVWINANSNIR